MAIRSSVIWPARDAPSHEYSSKKYCEAHKVFKSAYDNAIHITMVLVESSQASSQCVPTPPTRGM